LKTYFATRPYEAYQEVPWTPLVVPLPAATVALVTTAGINVRGVEPPFDYARERIEPHWGDPSFRTLPRDVRQEQIQTGHLHINNAHPDRDINVAFPVHRLAELRRTGSSAGWRLATTRSWASRRTSRHGARPTGRTSPAGSGPMASTL
jgi:hypothetical protein